MLYRAIKYQVDKGPVDAVTGKAKRTLNDSHLLREDIDYCAMVTMATHIDTWQGVLIHCRQTMDDGGKELHAVFRSW